MLNWPLCLASYTVFTVDWFTFSNELISHEVPVHVGALVCCVSNSQTNAFMHTSVVDTTVCTHTQRFVPKTFLLPRSHKPNHSFYPPTGIIHKASLALLRPTATSTVAPSMKSFMTTIGFSACSRFNTLSLIHGKVC